MTRSASSPFGGSVEVRLDGGWPGALTFSALYNTRLVPQIPDALAAAADGDVGALDPLIDSALFFYGPALGLSEGMSHSVICSEEIPFNDETEVAADAASAPAYLETLITGLAWPCDLWNVTPSDPLENEPVSDAQGIPILIFAGSFDPITPPTDSRLVADRLGATYIEVPAGGHGALPTTGCTRQIFQTWLRDPTTQPDLSCIEALDPPNFIGFQTP